MKIAIFTAVFENSHSWIDQETDYNKLYGRLKLTFSLKDDYHFFKYLIIRAMQVCSFRLDKKGRAAIFDPASFISRF